MKYYASQREQPRQQSSNQFITNLLKQLFFQQLLPMIVHDLFAMGKECGRWRHVKTSAAGLETARKRRGRALQTPTGPGPVLNKLQKTDRKAKTLKKWGTFMVLCRTAEYTAYGEKKKSSLQLKRQYNSVHKIDGIHKGAWCQTFMLKVISQMCQVGLKLHSLRPYTSLESGCNTQGTRGHPSVRQPNHTVNSPPKLTWWQETGQSETSFFVTYGRVTKLLKNCETCRAVTPAKLETTVTLKSTELNCIKDRAPHPDCNSSTKNSEHLGQPLSKHIRFTHTLMHHNVTQTPNKDLKHLIQNPLYNID